MSHGGKGYVQRPTVVDQEVMESNWDRIFGNRNKARACKETCAKEKAECQKDSACPGKEKASGKEDS
jgi:hypothetical protein